MYHLITLPKMCWIDFRKSFPDISGLDKLKILYIGNDKVDIYYPLEKKEDHGLLKNYLIFFALGWSAGGQRGALDVSEIIKSDINKIMEEK